MLETTSAQIGFFIWAIFTVAIYFGVTLKCMNILGSVTCAISSIITGILLYIQNWSIFFGYVSIATVITVFISPYFQKVKTKNTIPQILVAVGTTFLLCYGAYGVLYLLNN